MKVHFVYLKAYSSVGGIESFNQNFIMALIENGVNFSIYSLYDDLEDEHILCFNGSILSMAISLGKNVKSGDIVFVGHINMTLLFLPILIFQRSRKIYMILHGIDAWQNFTGLKLRILRKMNFLAVSHFTASEFSKLNLIPEKFIQIFPNSLPYDFHIQNQFNSSDDSVFNILTVSRLSSADSYKGIDVLIKSFKLLLDRHPNLNVRLDIIGKGDDMCRLQTLTKEYGLSNVIVFHGYVKEIEDFYVRANLFVLPSLSEGFGIVYLEAMINSTPVIAADSGGVTDFILDNQTGFLVRYGDEVELTNKIQYCIDNKQLLETIIENGKTLVHEKYSFDSYKNRLNEIIDKS